MSHVRYTFALAIVVLTVAVPAWSGDEDEPEPFAFTNMQRGATGIVDAFVFNVGSNDDSVSDTATVTLSDFPTTSTAAANASFGDVTANASGTAGGTHTTTFAQQKDGTWTGSSTGSSYATTMASGEGAGANSTGTAFSNFRFEFGEGQVRFTATGVLNASTDDPNGTGSSRLRIDGLPEPFLLRAKSPPAPDFDLFETQAINVDLTLDPGTYILSFGGTSQGTIAQDVSGMAVSASYNIDFTISHTGGGNGGDPTIYFWEGNSGDFDDMTNWDPEGVPGVGDVTVFDKDQTYTVNFGIEAAGRAIIDRGPLLDFVGTGFELTTGTMENPSFVVGNETADPVNLSLLQNLTLDTQFAAVGLGAVGDGSVYVGDETAAGWLNEGTLTVGDGGTGLVSVSGGGRIESDALALGYEQAARGTLFVRSQGTMEQPSVESETTMVGVDGMGSVEVVNDIVSLGALTAGVNGSGSGALYVRGSSGLSEILCSLLTLGDGGAGSLVVETLSTFTSEDNSGFVGKQEDGTGSVLVDGCGATLNLPYVNIGNEGFGYVEVINGGLYEGNAFILGQAFSGSGEFFVSGQCEDETPSRLILGGEDGFAIIGSAGEGVLRIADGAECQMNSATAGFQSGGVGLIVVAAAQWTVSGTVGLGVAIVIDEELPPATGTILLQDNGTVHVGTIIVEEGSGVYGNGVLEMDAPGMCEGTIGSGVWIEFATNSSKGGEMPSFGRSRGHATLNIQGDMDVSGGEIDLSIGGLGNGQYDRIVFQGDAALSDTTLRLRFTEGFAPQTGDKLPILSATGNLTATNLTLLFEGLADGFMYQVNDEGGILEFEAMSDGEATSPGATDLNVDGSVNAVDVQLAINSALGLVPVPTGDVNFDGSANAIDVQLVINGALGVV